MALSFFGPAKETPLSLTQKAEELLDRAQNFTLTLPTRFAHGESRLKQAGRNGEFRQFRDYRAGDGPKDIDWKRSARSDDMLVRERERKERRLIDLHIQTGKGMHFRSHDLLPTKYETACVISIAFSLWAERQHDNVRFFGEKTNARDLPYLLLGDDKTKVPEWEKSALTILIGDYTEPMEELDPILKILTGPVLWLQILDPAEIELPYQGHKIFEDGQVSARIDNVDAMRNAYQSNLKTHLSDLKTYAQNRHWYYDMIRTDQDCAPAFNRALASLEVTR